MKRFFVMVIVFVAIMFTSCTQPSNEVVPAILFTNATGRTIHVSVEDSASSQIYSSDIIGKGMSSLLSLNMVEVSVGESYEVSCSVKNDDGSMSAPVFETIIADDASAIVKFEYDGAIHISKV